MQDSPHRHVVPTAEPSQHRPLTAAGVLATLALLLAVPGAAWVAHDPATALPALAGATGGVAVWRRVRSLDAPSPRPVRRAVEAAAGAVLGE